MPSLSSFFFACKEVSDPKTHLLTSTDVKERSGSHDTTRFFNKVTVKHLMR